MNTRYQHHLELAIQYAAQWHAGQKDKAGEPYLLHVTRVMMKQKTLTTQIVALFHDAIEDAPSWEAAESRQRIIGHTFGESIHRLVMVMSRRAEEDYLRDYIPRVNYYEQTRLVKLADLEDNMDTSRLRDVTEHDRLRWAKYAQAKRILERA